VRLLRLAHRGAVKARTQAASRRPAGGRRRQSRAPRHRRQLRRLCGASPIEASSGRNQRHRLNRGGDRQANCALFTVVLNRLTWDECTRAYMAKRTAEGKSKKEVIRCLERYVARELYREIRKITADILVDSLPADISEDAA